MTRYLNLLLIILFISLLLVFGLNRIVNPYDLFSGPEFDVFNREKPETKTRQRMSKAYQVIHQRPEAIVLGTSRALALDPEHTHWNKLTSFNLALTNSSIYEQWRYLQHAQATNSLREVVIGLDHFMFNGLTGKNFVEERLSVNADGSAQQNFIGYEINDLMAGLLSLDAFRSSLVTIDQQETKLDPVTAKRQRIIAKGGHWGLFTGMERNIFHRYASKPPRKSYGEIGSYDNPGSLRKILRFAHQHDIQLYFFISPSHARMWEAWRIVGLSEVIDVWKRAVVEANEDEARMASNSPFPIWDFSGYNSVTTERLPTHNEIEQLMFGYWEGSHYSDEVAEIILDRVFDYEGSVRKVPDDFGVRLSSQNIEAHLGQVKRAGERYRIGHEIEIQSMEDLFDYYLQKQAEQ